MIERRPRIRLGSSRWVWRPDVAAFDVVDGAAALGGCPDAGVLGPSGFRTGDADGDGAPDLFDGRSLLRGAAILDPAAGCDELVITTFADADRAVRGGATGDLDGDGVSDLILLVVDPAEVAEVQVHRGPLPPGTFGTEHAEVVLPWRGEAPFSAYGQLDVADVDGDGRDDLALAMDAPRGSPVGMGAVWLWRGIDLLPQQGSGP